MAGTLIKGGYLMTQEGIKKDWGIRIEGNRIVEAAPNDLLMKRVPENCKVLDASDRLVSPGFVNGHMHMYGVLSHGITVEALVTEFSSFLEDFWWPYVEDRMDHELVEKTTRWACVEMIKSGITTFMDVLEGPNSIPGALEVEAKVVHQAGLRGILTFEACERMNKENGQLGLKENADLVRKYHQSESLVQGMMSIHTLFTADREYVVQAKELAQELGCDIHMHLSESVYEPNWTLSKYGKRPVDIYEELGYMGPNVVASQGVQLEPHEIDIIAKRGAKLVHMPLSNCEVGGGVAPVPDCLAKGIKVGLGTDGYVNSFFEVMRGAFLIHKAYRQDPQVMPAKDVYRMATSLGAEVLGYQDLGKLEPGCLADMITIKMDTPTPINEHNVYDQLVLFRNPSDVVDVMVNGNLVMENGKLLTLDEEQAKAEIRESADQFWKGNK
ncbi:amidohydrolase family protein [Candidatus Formimonas warabiya]|uniref:Amidohydrolase n=1 Tax=Formimonas warabiya TaxID=1761012 RepID=A0A3G1KTQ0_FORW1|nr:amidohydrolase family protein [Candidatus Formimonas warabiya]ATW25841.1 amidohydrolase [Candidatus Formimonas warabiya]